VKVDEVMDEEGADESSFPRRGRCCR